MMNDPEDCLDYNHHNCVDKVIISKSINGLNSKATDSYEFIFLMDKLWGDEDSVHKKFYIHSKPSFDLLQTGKHYARLRRGPQLREADEMSIFVMIVGIVLYLGCA